MHLRVFEHTGTGPPGYPWAANKVTGHMGYTAEDLRASLKTSETLAVGDRSAKESRPNNWLQRRETHS